MAASVSTIVTLGFGTFGSVNLLPTLGYGTVVVLPIPYVSDGWAAPASLLHYDAYPMLLGYDAVSTHLHYEAFPMLINYTAPKSRTEGEANEP